MPNAYGNNEVYAVIVSQEKIDESALRAHSEARIPRPFVPVKYLFAERLPHNETGKLDRRRLREVIKALAVSVAP